jgi:hypothetical protein
VKFRVTTRKKSVQIFNLLASLLSEGHHVAFPIYGIKGNLNAWNLMEAQGEPDF